MAAAATAVALTAGQAAAEPRYDTFTGSATAADRSSAVSLATQQAQSQASMAGYYPYTECGAPSEQVSYDELYQMYSATSSIYCSSGVTIAS